MFLTTKKPTCFGQQWPIVSSVKKPDDSHCWPKHVVFFVINNVTSNYTYILVFLTTYPLISHPSVAAAAD